MQSHIAELARRHQALEKEIASAQHAHGADDLRLLELKRKKLLLKDAIAKLKH